MHTNSKNLLLPNLIAITASLLLFVVSCKKITELSPRDSLAENTAFTDPGKIELVANGIYEQAAVGTYDPGTGRGAGRGYPFGAASIEQAEMRGEDMVNLATFYAITYQATQTSSSANNVNHWEQLYALVNQANVLIEGVNKAAASNIITGDVAKSYEAEGRFLRALSHHELLIHFCRPYADGNGSKPGVPYREKATNSPAAVTENAAIGRGTVAETYQKILADLDFAEANLPETQPNGAARATKAAAIALKTRVKLHMGDWAGVIAEGAKLGTNAATGPFASPIGGYKLEADPATPFASNAKNTESIFSIANSAASNGGVNGALPAMFGPATGPGGAGRGLVAISPNLYNASFWVAGDKRRNELTIQDGSAPKLFFTYKYKDYGARSDWAPTIRYAEVLLNAAEAYSRTGNKLQAFALLNAVRNRSVPAADAFLLPPVDLTLAVLQERRIEFSAEGRRWPDIHRLALDPNYGLGGGNGIPAKINPSQITAASYGVGNPPIAPARAAIAYSDNRFLWPIPTSEITSNPTLASQQNPGY